MFLLCRSRWFYLELRKGLDLEQAVEASAVHEVGVHEPGEGERTDDGALRRLREAKQQESDECHGDLNAHGVLGGAEEAPEVGWMAPTGAYEVMRRRDGQADPLFNEVF